jgi:carbamoyl-phosphate synthase large subunit
MKANQIEVNEIEWPLAGKGSSALDLIKSKSLDLVINIPKNFQEEELTNDIID